MQLNQRTTKEIVAIVAMAFPSYKRSLTNILTITHSNINTIIFSPQHSSYRHPNSPTQFPFHERHKRADHRQYEPGHQ